MKISITLEPNGCAIWQMTDGKWDLLHFIRGGGRREGLAFVAKKFGVQFSEN